MPPNASAPWDIRLRDLMLATRCALRAHPHALPVMATHPAFTQASVSRLEAAGAILHDAGFSPHDAMQAVGVISGYVIGISLAEVGLQPGGIIDPSKAEVLTQVAQLPEDEYPVLTAAFSSEIPFDGDTYFANGLDIFITGLKVRRGEIAG
jgi:hypothetical protein